MNYDTTIEDLVNALCEEQGIVLWKDIPGYEGMYQVSNVGGMVRSVDRYVKNGENSTRLVKGKMLRSELCDDGYVRIPLFKDNKVKMHLVHRLVAMAFIPNPLNLTDVNHINECKSLNNAANLEWCDRRHNNCWATKLERTARTQGRVVRQYTLEGELVAEYWSAMEAHRQTGYSQECISGCCRGKYKQANGYVWRYAT